MASLSDENLRKHINKINVDDMKHAYLIINTESRSEGMSRETLAWHLFTAIRLGLPVLESVEEEDRIIMERKEAKLKIDFFNQQIVTLPHPFCISSDAWDIRNIANYPSVVEADVRRYFTSRKYMYILSSLNKINDGMVTCVSTKY